MRSTLRSTALQAAEPASGEDRAARIIAGFHAALGEMRCVGSERMLRLGVSMSHLHVMTMLERHGEMTMSSLAEMLDVSLSNATGLIDRMEERGFVERCRVPDDRRVVLVRITEAGSQLLAQVDVLRDDLLLKVLGRLDPAALERLDMALADIRGAASAVLTTEPSLDWHQHLHTHEHPHGHAVPAPEPGPVAASHRH